MERREQVTVRAKSHVIERKTEIVCVCVCVCVCVKLLQEKKYASCEAGKQGDYHE